MGRVSTKPTSFIERKRPIDAIRRKLARTSLPAVDVLEKIMLSAESSTAEKSIAAKTLLVLYKEILTKDSDDKIKRLELQLKYQEELLKLGNGTTVEDMDEDDDSPLLDFENIAEVE